MLEHINACPRGIEPLSTTTHIFFRDLPDLENCISLPCPRGEGGGYNLATHAREDSSVGLSRHVYFPSNGRYSFKGIAIIHGRLGGIVPRRMSAAQGPFCSRPVEKIHQPHLNAPRRIRISTCQFKPSIATFIRGHHHDPQGLGRSISLH
ncbi:hypothetical protein B0H17DRAFT_1148187 [Mycena rosella]|uniref:Uncharacterized protein n=1 Tax=Mycena rosella TaxID=1033263 RepID=A0AAD7CFD1_MYCRO|nr:hypothetical protein B0H17DRAFT_1148187 [Mycena rosella]